MVDHLDAGDLSMFLIAFGAGACESTEWQEITRATEDGCHEVTDTQDVATALDRVAAVLWGGGHG